MTQWLWWLQSDTLSSGPAFAVFFSSPFLLSRLNSNVTSIIYGVVCRWLTTSLTRCVEEYMLGILVN